MWAVLRALGVLAIGFGSCAGVFAQAAEPQAAPQEASKATDPGLLFDRLDTTHAGVLSADKIPADKRGLFERLLRLAGKSADGQLTRAEFVAQLKSITEPPTNGTTATTGSGAGGSTSNPPAGSAAAKSAAPAGADGKKRPDPAKVFDRFDKHHAGKLTLADVPEERQKLFKRLLREAGKPAGGSLTKEEFVKAFDTVLDKRAGGPGAKTADAGAKKPANARQTFDVDTLVARLMKRSSRPDGKLTKSDLPERMQDRFDKIDANQDGFVDETELRAWLTKVKRQLAAAAALNSAPTASAANKATSNSDGSK